MSETNSYCPLPPVLTNADIARQFWLDAYGKEVQSAATYSYMWMADQAGHMGIGILLQFALSSAAWRLGPLVGQKWLHTNLASEIVGMILTTLVVATWEYSAYRADVRKADGAAFPLQHNLLQHNAVAAAAYMALGGIIGWGLQQPVYYAYPIVGTIFVIVVITAIPWLRQKIIWQKAALPYLARLADFRPRMPPETAHDLWHRITKSPVPPDGPPTVVVIAGAPGTGRTLLSCSIGTEFAFNNATVRYVGFNQLIEMSSAHDYETAPPPGPANIQYWPWSQAQVLIIDDMGPLIGTMSRDAHGIQSLALGDVLRERLAVFRPALSQRHTIWLMGEAGGETLDELQRSAETIAAFLGVSDPLAILLTPEDVTSRTG